MSKEEHVGKQRHRRRQGPRSEVARGAPDDRSKEIEMDNRYDRGSREHGRSRGRGRGMRGMEGPGGGWGGGPGPGWGGGRRRMRRGDIRRAVLSTLRDGPAHGYEVM